MAYEKPILPAILNPIAFDSAVGLQALNSMNPAAWKVQFGYLVQCLVTTLNSMCFSVAGTAVGTTKAKAKTTNAIQYSINGKAYTKAGTDNFWTLTTACNTTNAYWNGVWLGINAGGTAILQAGTQATTQAGIVMPTPASTTCVVGYLTINPTGTGNFVGGTTDLDDATVTPNAVFYDLTFPGVIPLLS